MIWCEPSCACAGNWGGCRIWCSPWLCSHRVWTPYGPVNASSGHCCWQSVARKIHTGMASHLQQKHHVQWYRVEWPFSNTFLKLIKCNQMIYKEYLRFVRIFTGKCFDNYLTEWDLCLFPTVTHSNTCTVKQQQKAVGPRMQASFLYDGEGSVIIDCWSTLLNRTV